MTWDATQQTFGFDTAVACAVDALDRLHSTAQSHNRVMVLEVMGRYAGWIAAYAGLAGGADVILIPEIKFNLTAIEKKIRAREATGKLFTIVIVAEGAKLDDTMVVSDNEKTDREVRLGGIGYAIADKIQQKDRKREPVRGPWPSPARGTANPLGQAVMHPVRGSGGTYGSNRKFR